MAISRWRQHSMKSGIHMPCRLQSSCRDLASQGNKFQCSKFDLSFRRLRRLPHLRQSLADFTNATKLGGRLSSERDPTVLESS